jgi:endonuclease/exonuclease/phosphatase family metal-dependent hydrolase
MFFSILHLSETENRLKNVVKYLLLGLNVILVLSLLASYISSYIPPDFWWVPAFLSLAYPFILAGNIIFIVFWLLVKPKYIILSLVAILLGLGFLNRYIQLKGKTTDEEGIKVISYNVHHFQGEGKTNPNDVSGKIVNFLEEQDADIICLQEVRLRRNNIFNLQSTVDKLSNINHYQYARSSTTYGSVTMTRYPIISMGEIRFEDTRNMTIYTDIVIQKDTVRIFNVHLQSYLIDPKNYSVIDSLDLMEEKDIRELRDITKKFKTASEMRAEQVRQIREHIDKSPYKVLVCGDFNDSPGSFSYQRIRGKLKDAFVESGRGIGQTYVGRLPSFRIDYIFHSKGFNSFNFKTIDFHMSDHLPISCVLVKKKT